MRSEGKEELRTTCENRLASGLTGIQAHRRVFESDGSDGGEAQGGKRNKTLFASRLDHHSALATREYLCGI